jgi:hypothetical protein
MVMKNGSVHILVYKKIFDQYSYFFVLKPDWLFLFQSMKRKQKSCQNEPSAGRFDGSRARSDLLLLLI